MFVSRRRVCTVVATCAIGLAAGAARADDASTQQMQQKIDQLESQVQALQTQQAQNQTNNSQAVQQVITDADNHSQLLAPMTGGAGYDPATGFMISSDDGNFTLHPWLLGQFQGVINDRQSVHFNPTNPEAPAVQPITGSHEADGFEVHNMEIGFNGHIGSPRLEYYFMIDSTETGGVMGLVDAYGTYRLGDDSPWKIKAGQFIDPVWHESNVGDGDLLTVDRSLASVLVGGAFGTSVERVQGVGLQYQNNMLHAEADLTDGYASANTPFFDTAVFPYGAANPENFGMSGRVDYKVSGDSWEPYNSLSAHDAKSDVFVVGLGGEWTEAESFDTLDATVDAQLTTATGWDIFGSFMVQYQDWADDHSLATTKANAGYYPNFGLIAQVGYMLNPQWEPFARYDVTVLNTRYADILAYGTNAPPGKEKATGNSHELTAGVNYYLFDKNAKITGDVSFLPNGSPIDAEGLGILANEDHSEWVGRLQFQLSI